MPSTAAIQQLGNESAQESGTSHHMLSPDFGIYILTVALYLYVHRCYCSHGKLRAKLDVIDNFHGGTFHGGALGWYCLFHFYGSL